MKKKNREFQSSDLVKSFARIHGFEEKLMAFEVKDYLNEYMNGDLFQEIESVNLNRKVLQIKIKSPLLRNDFRLRKTFFLQKFQEKFGSDHFIALEIS